MPHRYKPYTMDDFERELMGEEHREEEDEDCPSEAEILDQTLSDWFPNARTEADLDYELECLSWGDD